MSSTGGDTAKIGCPFYRYHDGVSLSVGCEGWIDECVLVTRFKQKQDYHIHMDAFCKGRYKACELYRMLMATKYAEDE